MLGEIGSKNTEFLPDIIPVLTSVLDDDTPAVVRQAISCGINLFHSTLEKIAIQVFYFNTESTNSYRSIHLIFHSFLSFVLGMII